MNICKKSVSLLLALLLVLGASSVMTVASFAIDGGEPTVKVRDCESALTLGFKESKTFEFETENLPEGAVVHVFCSGEDRGEGLSITVEKPTADYTVQAKVFDKDGSVIAESEEIKVTVKNGIFDRLMVFLRRLSDGVADVLSAILLNIWIWIKR